MFLSSRAVYGPSDPDVLISEKAATAPDTLYGEVKLAAEKHLDRMIDQGWIGGSLRVTGVYGPAGPGREHKWSGLFRDFLAGRPIEPRIGTEVHGNDVAEAVRLMLTIEEERLRPSRPGTPAVSSAFNVSDIVVDRHDLLKIVKEALHCRHALPARADLSKLNRMAAGELRALGWNPGGYALLEQTVREMLRSV